MPFSFLHCEVVLPPPHPFPTVPWKGVTVRSPHEVNRKALIVTKKSPRWQAFESLSDLLIAFSGPIWPVSLEVCVWQLTAWEANWAALFLRAGPSFRAAFLVQGTGLEWLGLKIQSTTGTPSLTCFRSCPALSQVRRVILTREWTSKSPGGLVHTPVPGPPPPNLLDSVGREWGLRISVLTSSPVTLMLGWHFENPWGRQ